MPQLHKSMIELSDEQTKERLLNSLLAKIEEVSGRKMQTPRDFDLLGESIFHSTGHLINPSTLKRIFGYVKSEAKPRETTLDILCRYARYDSWQAFINKERELKESESVRFFGRQIMAEELRPKERLRITWLPDRDVTIEYLGNGRFEVVAAENSKLRVGYTFECPLFIEHEPLYLTNLIGPDNRPANFLCGQKNGVEFEFVER